MGYLAHYGFMAIVILVCIVITISLSHALYSLKKNPLEYIKVYNSIDRNKYAKLYFIIVAIGLFVIFVSGFINLFFYLPNKWGFKDEYGDFTEIKYYIAFALGLICTYFVSIIFEKYLKNTFQLRLTSHKLQLYSKIIKCNCNYQHSIDSIMENSKEIENNDDYISSYLKQINSSTLEIIADIMNNISENDHENNVQRTECVPNKWISIVECMKLDNILHDDIDAISLNGLYCVDDVMIKFIYDYMSNKSKKHIFLTDEDIQRGEKGPINITKLLKEIECIKNNPEYELLYHYKGDSHGGTSEIYFLKNDEKYDISTVIEFKTNIPCLVTIFYIITELHKHCTYWHGFYGHDASYIFSETKLADILSQYFEYNKENVLAIINKKIGLNIYKTNNHIVVSCLNFKPNVGLCDFTMTISCEGEIIDCHSSVVLKTMCQMFY